MPAVSCKTHARRPFFFYKAQPVPMGTASVPRSFCRRKVTALNRLMYFTPEKEHSTFSNSSRWSFKVSSINKKVPMQAKKN